MKPYFTYTIWSERGCEYVGCTYDILRRFKQHQHRFRDVTKVQITTHASKVEALEEEEARIWCFCPIRNVAGLPPINGPELAPAPKPGKVKPQKAAKPSKPQPMTPADYGAHLAAAAPPLTDAQVEAAARILAADPEAVAAA